jgi:uncharacterized membrane protein YphA (DoxX/SURF4 family)
MKGILAFFFRIIPGLVFLMAGLAKISDPVRFLMTLREFQLFPDSIIRFLAVYLPWLEFVLGFLMVLGIMIRSSSLLLALLNIFFTVALVSLLIRGLEIDCGCFGLFADFMPLPDKADLKSIIRNLIFVGMCFFVFNKNTSPLSLEGYLRKIRSR